MTRLWGGAFTGEPAPEMIAFTRSAGFDVRLVAQDCRVLAAHAEALADAGILAPEQSSAAAQLLPEIAHDITSGSFAVDVRDEDVHTTVERALRERDPDLADRIRAGLSRNDRVATAFRLWIAEAAKRLAGKVSSLRNAIDERASEHDAAIMPGYTHLQRAQVVTLGAHLRAHATALTRSETRLMDSASDALAACPLGAGALAGTTLTIDRARTAQGLGFQTTFVEPLGAVSDREFVATFLFACALLSVTCSRIAEEIILWTTSEFGFASLDDAWATGSSLMPQKRNPDVAELARGKTGRVIGDLTGLLAALKGLPLAYNRDLQEDKEPAFDAYDTLDAMLPAMQGLMATLTFDTEAMARAAADPLLLATDLAEYLVSTGVPFTEAHERVGAAVRDGTLVRQLADAGIDAERSAARRFPR